MVIRLGRTRSGRVIKARPGRGIEKIKFSDSPGGALEILRGHGFPQALVTGGAKLNASFMEAGLVNEIYLDVEPFIFGQGISLFAPAEFEYKLKLLEVKKLSEQTIQLHYKVVKHG